MLSAFALGRPFFELSSSNQVVIAFVWKEDKRKKNLGRICRNVSGTGREGYSQYGNARQLLSKHYIDCSEQFSGGMKNK